jgi:hypothetical protein
MTLATADSSAVLSYTRPTDCQVAYGGAFPAHFGISSPLIYEILAGNLYAPAVQQASWLPAVQRRIRNSIAQYSSLVEDSDEWIPRDVGVRGISFFSMTSDLLPSEPHLSRTIDGSLVAECNSQSGSLCMVFSSTTALISSSNNGSFTVDLLELTLLSTTQIRQRLRALSSLVIS